MKRLCAIVLCLILYIEVVNAQTHYVNPMFSVLMDDNTMTAAETWKPEYAQAVECGKNFINIYAGDGKWWKHNVAAKIEVTGYYTAYKYEVPPAYITVIIENKTSKPLQLIMSNLNLNQTYVGYTSRGREAFYDRNDFIKRGYKIL